MQVSDWIGFRTVSCLYEPIFQIVSIHAFQEGSI